ncbi:hypothetical protein Q31b_05420 [Novipirellula aureliae]|uniref:Uncharacterized protein n=1 Tax=Novipirellula aureliae TaxID=2527966 RepID=A0A5C6E9A3_9BACT|nr:hypothetical protein [Novipirellula aureliae]TWU45370.1 hypothetical protein Q31b_05420 [Novipirellula aureliae]
MPLRRLSNELIRLGRDELTTPVLVLPPWISLRADFYKELAEAITSQTGQSVRFDTLRPLGGLWQTLVNKFSDWQIRQINRQVNRKGQAMPAAEVVLTASIARPTSMLAIDRTQAQTPTVFVIGIANEKASLPSWTTPIHLASSPISGVAA